MPLGRRIEWSRTGPTAIRFRQRKRWATAEVLPDQIALRWAPECPATVRAGLRQAVQVRVAPGVDVTLLEVQGGPAAVDLWRRLEELHAAGRLRFATPMLRDRESGLRQILTDEITVRWTAGQQVTGGLERLRRSLAVSLVRRSEFVERQCVVRLERAFGLATLEAAEAIDGLPEIEFAAANFISWADR